MFLPRMFARTGHQDTGEMESIEVPKALRKLGFKVTFEVWCFKDDKQHERGTKHHHLRFGKFLSLGDFCMDL